jgi:hypothetical protein
MHFTDKTKNLGQTQTIQTLAPTPYIKEQTPAQQTKKTPQQQKSQHPNLPPRPHTYGIHRLFPMEGDQKNKTTNSSPPLRSTQGTRARSDIEMANMFQPHRSENSPVEEEATPYQLDPPLNRLLRSEVHAVIKNLNPKKSPGYLITGKILQELLVVGIQYLIQIYNAVMLTRHFPAQWKVAQIILILKPGKTPNDSTSYHPISLLPILSKVFETTSKLSHLLHCTSKLDTQPSVWLPSTALYHLSNTSHCAQNK